MRRNADAEVGAVLVQLVHPVLSCPVIGLPGTWDACLAQPSHKALSGRTAYGSISALTTSIVFAPTQTTVQIKRYDRWGETNAREQAALDGVVRDRGNGSQRYSHRNRSSRWKDCDSRRIDGRRPRSCGKFYLAVRPKGAAVLLLIGSEGGYAPEKLARSPASTS
jgi:hypothetical protein